MVLKHGRVGPVPAVLSAVAELLYVESVSAKSGTSEYLPEVSVSAELVV